MLNLPTYAEILEQPYYSSWIKHNLRRALERDPVDAYKDACLLAELMKLRILNVENQNYVREMNSPPIEL